jgi:hypothetical protein
MLCQPQTSWTCEGGMAGTGAGGAPGGAGGAGGAVSDGGVACGPEGCEEPVCYEVPAPSLCMQRHFFPCEVASDCGGGFDCVESYYYECDGGGDSDAGRPSGGSGGVSGMSGAAGTGMGGEGADAGSDDPYECHQVPSGEHYCSLQNLPCESDTECPAGLECQAYYEYMPYGMYS